MCINYLFYLVTDNNDYIDILKFCCLKGHYLEIYNLKSTNTNNNIFNEYNLDNKIDDITTPLPDFSPNKLVNNIFNSDNTHYLTLIGSLGTFGTYIYLLENNKNIKYKNIKYNDNYKEYIIKYE